MDGALKHRDLGLKRGDLGGGHLGHVLVIRGCELPVFLQLAPGLGETSPDVEEFTRRTMLAQNFPCTLGIVEETGRGNLAFQLFETPALALDQGFKVHVSLSKSDKLNQGFFVARGARTVP